MVIRRIGVLSAAKIGGILGVAIGLLVGILFFLASSLGPAGMTQMQDAEPGAAYLAGMGALAIVVMPILYGVFGFIGGAIQAFIYNIATRFVGGLVVDAD